MKRTPPRPATPDNFEGRWRKHRRIVRFGQVLIGVGALVAVSHWLAHLEVFGPGQPPGWLDLAAGYPTGLVLVIAGAILAGRKRPTANS